MHLPTNLCPFQVVYGFSTSNSFRFEGFEEQLILMARKAKFVKFFHEHVTRNIEEYTKIYARKANKGNRRWCLNLETWCGFIL